ncbi:ArsR/SmtB family transcription factor [Catenulispora rubra]|uniref:ArsR/SmtB family transcription factor n=1 Tax=Catenulispora rubra TaxID=280293 RepID=UPI001891F49A|nr:helix-turn-helix domain-containing protein [Catenulispora rubra]
MSLESSSEAPQPSGQRWLVLDDATVIRAMAHPVRLELMGLIGREGRLTTADAARELGISHGLASHHLRQLAKYGFVEQTEGKDNRERPWRLVFTSQRIQGAGTDPEVADAADVLERISAEQAVAQFIDWQRRRRDWPEGWNEQAGLGRTNVYLTFEELAELSGAIDDLLLRYVNERPIDDLTSRPPGSVPVSITTITVPLAQPPEDR